jgi:hypothetical protein
VTPDRDQEVTLGRVGFVREGEPVPVYDPLPREPTDPRLIPLGQVPPVVFSEVMGDLGKIAGLPGGEGVDSD